MRDRMPVDGAIDSSAGERNRAVWVHDIIRQELIEGKGTAGG